MASDDELSRTRARISERLRALDSEAAALRQELELLDKAILVTKRYGGEVANDDFRGHTEIASTITVRKRPRNSSHEEVGDAALRVLAEAKAPMSRGDLFAAVMEQGVTIEGQDPEVVFSTMMWRERERVVNLKGHGYWPADRPYEKAGYDPEDK